VGIDCFFELNRETLRILIRVGHMRVRPILCLLPFLFVEGYAEEETFPAANGLVRSLVAEQPLLKNPVSVSVDVDGTIYVTETARRKVADLDIREFVKFGWVPRDVEFESIEEKRVFFEKQLDGKNVFKGTSLEDQNKDGVIDVGDLRAISEKIVRITDKDGDGVYDTSNVFAEGFDSEVTGIAAGVLAWGGDVYATIAPDLWKLRDTDGDGKADKRESIAHGFGIHIAYAGHDMHGLTPGPDGRLYWSIGDKGTNVTDKDGKNHFAPNEGAVLRCYPDGTGFEIFARGLRNPQEIAFDKYGNLFSVDNDADFKGERERFLHITEGSDTGWRNHYQYRGSAYNPWMEESIWKPTGEHQPAYITPTSGNFSDGPSGFAYNPGTALNGTYADAFFVTEFPKGNLLSFKVKPKGASFEIAESHTVLSGPMNVGINFGPDGALYSADWAGGYPLNEKGAVWRLDDPKEEGTAVRKEVAAMLKAGAKDVSTADLVERLSHADMRVRLDAQWELVRREAAIADLHQVIYSSESGQLAKIHAMWALTQQGRFFEKAFYKMATSDDPILRAQAAKHAGETLKTSHRILISLLEDPEPQVRFHAATAIWKTGDGGSIDEVIKMLESNDNQDAYLRHAGVLALSVSSPEILAEKTLNHKSAAVRLAGAVAFRRLKSPKVAELLRDGDSKVVAEAARAIFDSSGIVEAYPALANLIRDNKQASVPAACRSIAANRYLADSESAARLVNYAADESVKSSLRIAALEALASWTEASELNPVDGRFDPLVPADKEVAQTVYQPFAFAFQNSKDKEIRNAAALVAKNLGVASDPQEMKRLALDGGGDSAARIQALDALERADRLVFREVLSILLTDASAGLRARAASLLADHDPVVVTAYAESALAKSDDMAERQEAVRLLGKLKPTALEALVGKADSFLLIELSEALPEKKIEIDPRSASLFGGDAELGEIVFNEHLAAQCIACHRVGDEGSDVGPPLTKIGQAGRKHILESLLEPQAKVAAGYGMMTVKMKDGTSLAGVLKEEDEKFLKLVLPDKKEVIVNLSEAGSRTAPVSTMPPMGSILTPRQLRDLVEYLDGLR
jgi:quinoprotein glucose dehydrogenase